MEKLEVSVGKYVALRELKASKVKKHKESLALIEQAMEDLESEMASVLNETGQESAKTKNGTVFFTKKSRVGVEDMDEFYAWMVSRDDGIEFLNKAVNKAATLSFLEEEGTPPPGTKIDFFREVGIRKA